MFLDLDSKLYFLTDVHLTELTERASVSASTVLLHYITTTITTTIIIIIIIIIHNWTLLKLTGHLTESSITRGLYSWTSLHTMILLLYAFVSIRALPLQFTNVY